MLSKQHFFGIKAVDVLAYRLDLAITQIKANMIIIFVGPTLGRSGFCYPFDGHRVVFGDRALHLDSMCSAQSQLSRERKKQSDYCFSDTIANEVTVDPVTGGALPLHNALMRNLGVTLTETAWLEDLASNCTDVSLMAGVGVIEDSARALCDSRALLRPKSCRELLARAF